MDAEKRHQLKQNELAEALSHLRDIKDDPRTLYWVLAVVVVVLAVAGYKAWGWMRTEQLTASWKQLSDIPLPDPQNPEPALEALRRMVDEAPNALVAANARIRLAGALRIQAESTPEQREDLLQECVTHLQAVIDNPQMPPQLVATAAFSLATTYESLRDFDAAAEMYRLVAEDERFAGTPFVTVAQDRLETLDEVKEPVPFEPGSAPTATAPTNMPEEGPPAPPPLLTPVEAPAPATQPATTRPRGAGPNAPPPVTPPATQPGGSEAP